MTEVSSLKSLVSNLWAGQKWKNFTTTPSQNVHAARPATPDVLSVAAPDEDVSSARGLYTAQGS